ncbi:MAG: hypothetical protein HGB10_11095 [Coriobacteriia bacterium]|nr:hypothetical protein [Coriobacteriia bacterium]
MRVRPRGFQRTVSVFVLFLALACMPSIAHAKRTIGLSSGTFSFEVPESGELTGSVVVSSEGDEPIKVMVYAADQKIDATGKVSYTVPTRADVSSLKNPSSWVKVSMPANSLSIGNIPYLELAAGEKVPIEFSLSVPRDTAPGDHNILIFFESFDLPGGANSQSVISGRLGARIQLKVAGERFKKLEVRPFNVPTFVINGAVPYDFTTMNLGNTDVRVGARVLFLDRNGNTLAEQTPINGRTLFAGSNTLSTGTVMAQGLALGPHTVRLDVTEVDDEGNAINQGADTINQEKSVWLIPLWLIIAVGAFVVLVFVRAIWSASARNTQRKAERAADEERARALQPDDEE